MVVQTSWVIPIKILILLFGCVVVRSIKKRKGTKTARFQPTHLQRYGMFHSVVYLVLHMYDTTYYGEITTGTLSRKINTGRRWNGEEGKWYTSVLQNGTHGGRCVPFPFFPVSPATDVFHRRAPKYFF